MVATAGCAGIFQRSRPSTPAFYARQVAVAGELRVGSAERDITPTVGGYMSGFDIGRTSTGVASPLRVRAMVVEADGRPFAIVGIDNLGMLREDVDWIKAGIAGFANGDVFVCASHTHAGPDLIGLWGYWFLTSGRDRGYLMALRHAVGEAVAEARAKAVAAELVRGTGMLPSRGLLKNTNRAGVFDRRLVVLQARAVADGRPVGTLLHLGCHPEVLPRGNTELSADFVGALCDEWRARGHGQAVFCNGALGGLISPAIRPRAMASVIGFGEQACDVAEAALRTGQVLEVDAIEVRRRDLFVPVHALGFRLGRLTGVLPRELHDGAARSTVGLLRIGSFTAVAVPGEMEPALAERIRAELGLPDLVVFGLCDDELGYLMREEEARDPLFAYEVSMSACLLAGEMVRAAITGMP
ncbi:MAG: hypothetical protein KDC98_14995 [Planctomycetes bacterium]|nr:hypothetical protein [Planctomycetota bacterium]